MAPVSKIQEEEEIEEEWEKVKIVPLKLATEGFLDDYEEGNDVEEPLVWGAVTRNWEWRKSMIGWHWLAKRAGIEESTNFGDELETWLALSDWEFEALLPAAFDLNVYPGG